MKTYKDIMDMIAELYFTEDLLCKVGECYDCPKLSWCYIDSYILSMSYIAKGVYYG